MGRRSHAALIAALAAASLVACKRDGPDWRILQLYSGETSVEVLRRPSKVTACRVDPISRAPKPGETRVGSYTVAGAQVEAPPEVAAELSSLLSDADAYDWRKSIRGMAPQIGLQFVKGAYVLEVVIDFDSAATFVSAGGQPLGWKSIAPSRDRLLALVKRALPDDVAVQALR